MFRLRLVSLTLASSVLLTLSGCCSFCEDGRMFPRLFNRTSSRPMMMDGGPECECNHSAWTPGVPMPVGQGPFMAPSPGVMPPGAIPITNAPAPPAPQLFRVPQAPPTAYVPGN